MKRLPRPIKSDLKSRRFVWDEERAIRWPYYKILREFSTLKQFYPEIDPYAEVYRMRDNVYACFSESLDGAGDVWSFVIDGPGKAMVIDTGFGIGDFKGLVKKLVGDKPLIVVNTHSHYDHAYGNCQFERCYCSEAEVARMEKKNNPHIWDYLFDENGNCRFTEFDRNDLVKWREYEIVGVEDGHIFDRGAGYEVELVMLPGHSPGQSGYYDHHNHIIFTGDTGGICDAVPGEPYPENCTVEALRDALKKLEPRMDEIEAVFPGHGMLDQTGETLRYLLHAAEAILEDPERYDEMTERFSPSTGETKKIMMKYIYQGSAIRYNRHNVYKKDQLQGAEA